MRYDSIHKLLQNFIHKNVVYNQIHSWKLEFTTQVEIYIMTRQSF